MPTVDGENAPAVATTTLPSAQAALAATTARTTAGLGCERPTSEVEVRFTASPEGTKVTLEHRGSGATATPTATRWALTTAGR